MPADIVASVSSGQVDRRLFDVPVLLDMGYADSASGDLPILVTGSATTSAVDQAPGGSTAVVRAVRVPKKKTADLWPRLAAGLAADSKAPVRTAKAPTGRVWLDGLRKVSLDQSVPQIGAPVVWGAGFTGLGVKVAVLDTGIDASHPDLAGRIEQLRNFTTDADANDVIGHGTHVASTIAGSGAASGGRYKGVAPDATLLVGKVCTWLGCPESAILAGMEWAAASGAAVVNLSLGGADNAEVDPLEEAVNRLTAQSGTLFVIAAGNNGADATIGSPARRGCGAGRGCGGQAGLARRFFLARTTDR